MAAAAAGLGKDVVGRRPRRLRSLRTTCDAEFLVAVWKRECWSFKKPEWGAASLKASIANEGSFILGLGRVISCLSVCPSVSLGWRGFSYSVIDGRHALSNYLLSSPMSVNGTIIVNHFNHLHIFGDIHLHIFGDRLDLTKIHGNSLRILKWRLRNIFLMPKIPTLSSQKRGIPGRRPGR